VVLGATDGAFVIKGVGTADGSGVGDDDGVNEGTNEGDVDGAAVGSSVPMQLESSLGSVLNPSKHWQMYVLLPDDFAQVLPLPKVITSKSGSSENVSVSPSGKVILPVLSW
jgi:hypothetical protein